jgi:hypothetical protein
MVVEPALAKRSKIVGMSPAPDVACSIIFGEAWDWCVSAAADCVELGQIRAPWVFRACPIFSTSEFVASDCTDKKPMLMVSKLATMNAWEGGSEPDWGTIQCTASIAVSAHARRRKTDI